MNQQTPPRGRSEKCERREQTECLTGMAKLYVLPVSVNCHGFASICLALSIIREREREKDDRPSNSHCRKQTRHRNSGPSLNILMHRCWVWKGHTNQDYHKDPLLLEEKMSLGSGLSQRYKRRDRKGVDEGKFVFFLYWLLSFPSLPQTLTSGETLTPEFTAMNPFQCTPALKEADGFALWVVGRVKVRKYESVGSVKECGS